MKVGLGKNKCGYCWGGHSKKTFPRLVEARKAGIPLSTIKAKAPVDPPQPKKKGRPPKATNTTSNVEPTIGQKKRRGFTVLFENSDAFPSLMMTVLVLQLQEIREAQENMAAGGPHAEIPPLL
ncbi:OLC1v1036082C1 [Oldenlandia corymbosa var. corymbosa]|uniref:OLC1v1036082C1 n=1 Tax=Oldenlandia corymbosa var. corymbosa TaxID=529605 RepID=A0AAV1CX25_OLDCO|nr:OLC1v1036082C1 [Oldenlandia corymbosa var. corymbosa]